MDYQTKYERRIYASENDWVHLGTLGNQGGELAAAHPHVLGRSRWFERWTRSCYLDICVGAALRPRRIAACDRRVQSKFSVL
jgi:hypothetical protein